MVTEGLIEDVRTLHELRMLDTEQPKKAQDLMQKIRNNQVSGSYRQVISGLRQAKNKKSGKSTIRKVEKLELSDNQLIIHVTGVKHPVVYEVSPEVLSVFEGSLA